MRRKIFFVFMMLVCAMILIGAQLKTDRAITPENAILGTISAAKENNAGKFLAYFCDDIKILLEEQRDNLGEELFNQRIMKNYKNLIGIAISDQEEIGPDMTNLTVEFVFERTNEIKSYMLKKTRNDWKIKEIIDHKKIS